MILEAFPRSAAYLRGMGVRLDDPGLNDYWCAVILADAAFTDEELTEAGTVDFACRDGSRLMTALDDLLRNRKRITFLPQAEMDSLKAFLGSRGVKVNKLKTAADFWSVAGILWPGLIKPTKSRDLADLLQQLRIMSKKQRGSAHHRKHLIPAAFAACAA